MAKIKESTTVIAPDAFYATGNPLIATVAEPEPISDFLVIE
jgi:hypothetical protein